MQGARRTAPRLDHRENTLLHHNQNTKSTDKERILKAAREKRPGNIQRQTYQNYLQPFNRPLKDRRAWADIFPPLKKPTDANLDYYTQQNLQSL